MIDIINAIRGISSKIQNLAAPQYDGVYFDSVNGTAGTGAGVGTPQNPSSVPADALTIATARKLNNIYIAPGTTFALAADLPRAFHFIGDRSAKFTATHRLLQGSTFSGLYVDAEQVDEGSYDNGAPHFEDCFIFGANIEGTFTHCEFTLSGTVPPINNSKFIDCTFNELYLSFDTSAGAPNNLNLYIYGAKGTLNIETMTNVNQYCEIHGVDGLPVAISSDCSNGTIIVLGGSNLTDQSIGSCVVVNQTGNIGSEKPVNVNAISASETNVLLLNQTNAWGSNPYAIHYTLDSLVLKCVDPGANTVNVNLYQNVNGVLTNTHTFAITTANYTVYRNLADLFNVYILAGDAIKITVQSTGGGPYAVTGSYVARSA